MEAYPFRAVPESVAPLLRLPDTVLVVNALVACLSTLHLQSIKSALTCQVRLDKIIRVEIPKQYEVLDPVALARYLGYTRSTIWTHVSRERWDKIPPPSRRLAMGPVWYVGDVEEWKQVKGG